MKKIEDLTLEEIEKIEYLNEQELAKMNYVELCLYFEMLNRLEKQYNRSKVDEDTQGVTLNNKKIRRK